MALLLLALGFYLRHNRALSRRPTLILSGLFLALFFTHLVATGLALITIGTTALWTLRTRPLSTAVRQLAAILIAAAPVLILTAIFAGGAAPPAFEGRLVELFVLFPSHAFWISGGTAGHQVLPFMIVLVDFLAAIAMMDRQMRNSPVGGLILSAILSFGLYLLVPDTALGGGDIKVRFAWTTVVLGVLAANKLPRPHGAAAVVSLLVTGGMLVALASAQRVNASYSRATDNYAAAFRGLPPGGSFVRLCYGTPDSHVQFGFPDGLPFLPLLHADAYAAAELGLLDLSD